MNELGVIMAAYGKLYYRRAATRCALSIRQVMPGMPITIFTDDAADLTALARNNGLEDVSVEEIRGSNDQDPPYAGKIEACRRSPYTRTVFLDADCIVMRPFEELFGSLDVFSIMCPHAFQRGGAHYRSESGSRTALAPLSSSIIVWESTKEVTEVFSAWSELYEKGVRRNRATGDQGYLAEAIYESDVRLYILQSEYHFHIGVPDVACGEIKVVTGDKDALNNENIISILNSRTGTRRVYFPPWRSMLVFGVSDRKAAQRSSEVQFTVIGAQEGRVPKFKLT